MAELIEMLHCPYPIIQGPIGRMNSARFVAAVCEAGAYGMLALGFSDAETTKQLVKEVRSLTDKPFGANIMLTNAENPKILEELARGGVRTITTSVGNPGKMYGKIHEAGMKGLHVVLSLAHAKRAEDAGADGLVVVGSEAGGLRTTLPESSSMVLVPLVADHVRVPVVAAGGIADSRGYRAAMALGARGVQVGTRFLASAEAPAHEKWKEAIVSCGDGGTILLPIGNMAVRVIITPKIRDAMRNPGSDLSTLYDFGNLIKAIETADLDLFPFGAGEVSACITEIKPIREIIEEMVS